MGRLDRAEEDPRLHNLRDGSFRKMLPLELLLFSNDQGSHEREITNFLFPIK